MVCNTYCFDVPDCTSPPIPNHQDLFCPPTKTGFSLRNLPFTLGQIATEFVLANLHLPLKPIPRLEYLTKIGISFHWGPSHLEWPFRHFPTY